MAGTAGWTAPDAAGPESSGDHQHPLPTVPGVVFEDIIGRGGFATVYRAHQSSVDRKVAVKVDDRRLLDERDRRRYTRETIAAGRVSAHPNIVTLYDAGTTADGRPYLVMELCPGGSYATRMRLQGPIDPVEILDTGIAIADALAAAHADGILHRDVKPGNILLTRYGTAALADFGLATLPRPDDEPSVTLESLTPLYAPPEAFELRPPAVAGDIYSLGATLYGMLQGRPPHSDEQGHTPSLARLLLLLNDPLPTPDVPAATILMPAIRRATALDPEQRFSSMEEFRDALAAIRSGHEPLDGTPSRRGVPATASGSLAGELLGTSASSGRQSAAGVTVAGGGTVPAPSAAGRRRRWLSIAVGLLVVAVLAVGTVWLLNQRGTPEEQNAGSDATAGEPLPTGPAPTGTGAGAAGAAPPASVAGSGRPDATGPIVGSTAEQPPPVGGCYGGMRTDNFTRVAAEVTCGGHYFESFATGVVSQDIRAPYYPEYEKDPAVRRACTEDSLRDYLGPGVDGRFSIYVLPTDQYAFIDGSRSFHCLAAYTELEPIAGTLRDGK